MATFLETPRFPETISYGASGGPQWNTDVIVVKSGHESRNSNWINSRLTYDVSHSIKSQDDLNTLIKFFRSVKGRAIGFRFKDWMDFKATHSEGFIGTGVGDGTPTYQLNKVYITGSEFEIRSITKPVSGTIALYEDSVQISGTLNYATGVVTFSAIAQSNATAITVGTTTQVTLTTNPGSLIVGQKLYLSGFTGIDAALVNNLAHTITTITGTGPYVFTLSTNTTGKTITVGSGVGKKFYQATDVLRWSGEFDVPVRFDTDTMKASIDSFSTYSWGQIPIVELKA